MTATLNTGENSVTLNFVAATVNVAEDWILARATYTYTYSAIVNRTAYVSINARLSTLKNNGDGQFRLETQVNLFVPYSPAIAAGFPNYVRLVVFLSARVRQLETEPFSLYLDLHMMLLSLIMSPYLCLCVCFLRLQYTAANTVATFPISGSDVDGLGLSWRLSTGAEMGGASFTQPQQFSVNPTSGCVFRVLVHE